MATFFRVHSGGVVRNGCAVLLVGPSGAGKSTLVTRLVADGFSLLSDDEIWIDPVSRLAHPSTRSLLLKESAWDLFPNQRHKFVDSGERTCRSWWLDADELRPGCRAAASPVWGVIAVRPPTGKRPSLETIGQAEALSQLLMESMNFPEVREAGLAALVEIIRTAHLYRLNNGDLNECAEMLDGAVP